MLTVRTASGEETQALGRRLSQLLTQGDTVLLTGDMGAGKSEMARGIARGLGVTCAVPSPTFTIMNAYEEGRLPVYHFDLYRVEGPWELTGIGLDEYIGGDGVALIEWHERARELMPATALEIALSIQPDGTRRIDILPLGQWEETHL